jgi:hypothetical protein
MEVILGLVQVYRRTADWDLIPEEAEISLPDQMRFWEHNEREKMNLEHGRRSGSIPEEALRLEDWILGMRMRLNGSLGRYLSEVERRLSGSGNALTYEV